MTKRRLLLVLGSAAVMGFFAAAAIGFQAVGLAKMSHRINEESFKLIRPGMTLEEVEEVLGVPAGDYTANKGAGFLLGQIREFREGDGHGKFWTCPDFGIFVVFTPSTAVKFNGTVQFTERIPYVGVLPTFPGQESRPPGGMVQQKPIISIPEPEFASIVEANLGNQERCVRVLAFSPDGKLLVTSHNDLGNGAPAFVVVWDIKQGSPRYVLEGHKNSVFSAAFSPDGFLLATGGVCNNLFFWDMKTGKKIGDSHSHVNHVYSLAFTPDGKYLASASMGIRLWDSKTLKEITTVVPNDTQELVFNAIFSPDGKRLFSGNQVNQRLFDMASGQWIANLGKEERHTLFPRATFSPDGTKIITNRFTDGFFRLWDAATGKPLGDWFEKLSYAPQRLLFAPDGKTVAVGGHGINDNQYNKIQITNWQTGKKISEIECKGSQISLLFSSDSQILAVGEYDGAFRLCNVSDGKVVQTFLEPPQPILALRFFGKEKLVSLTEDAVLHSWDLAAFQESQRAKLTLPPEELLAAWSPEGKHLATTSRKGTLRLWQTDTGKLLWQKTNTLAYLPLPKGRLNNPRPALLLSENGAMFSDTFGNGGMLPKAPIIFSASGKLLASPIKTGAVKVWETSTGIEMHQVNIPFPVKCLALSEKHLFFQSPDNNILIQFVDLSSGRQGEKIQLPPSALKFEAKDIGPPLRYVDSLVISPDGKHLAIMERMVFRESRDSVRIRRHVHLLNIDGQEQIGGSNTQEKIKTLPGFSGECAAFSSDSKFLAYHLPSTWDSPYQKSGVAIWDVDRHERKTFDLIDYNIRGFSFSPDNRMLAAIASASSILVWDIQKRFKKTEP